ncbi:hypothetical protein D9611_014094 [Ephemerocybe angulata]|uniref:HTH psq-type domain-containing protein n=1 Tax=Ephemerocybe angulata TaxID=980116 RepID=A0A8H5B9P4_9AGAR|nr:hypothetical protein D9611_014094 [Tulosesus angulatus]
MTGKSESNRVKSLKRRNEREDILRQAVKAYKDHVAAGGSRGTDGLRTIGARFGIPKSTLERHVKGKGKTKAEEDATRQKLTVTEEKTLAQKLAFHTRYGPEMSNYDSYHQIRKPLTYESRNGTDMLQIWEVDDQLFSQRSLPVC